MEEVTTSSGGLQGTLLFCLVALGASTTQGCAIGASVEDFPPGPEQHERSDSSASIELPDSSEEEDEPPSEPFEASVPAPVYDAGRRDAGRPPTEPFDAGRELDASAPSSGPEAGPPLDAGRPDTGVDAGARDAGVPVVRDSGTGGACVVSMCNNDCSLLGPLRCCRENNRGCGCSWAPGAYCN